MENAEKTVKIALLGCGTVGTQVARLLNEQSALLAARAGAKLELIGIAVNNLDAQRDPSIDRTLLTDDPYSLISKADIVIELIGGIEPARTLVRAALSSGASVVTGNKALLATHGPELYDLATQSDVDLYYEAAVAGAVPVVYGLRESLAGDQVNTVMGIMNGTTNFILDAMTTQGMDFDSALKLAQDLGFAEADPSADVDGYDAGAKIAILASLAFHTRVSLDDVKVDGIRAISSDDIASADAAGYVIKLIARAHRHSDEGGETGIEMSVSPTLVAKDHPLASVHGSFNAVLIEAKSADQLMFYGRGAGGAPTASAVLSDVVAAAAKRVIGGHAPREVIYGNLPVLPAAEFSSRYYIKLEVADAVGVLAGLTQRFAAAGVSISSVIQNRADGRSESARSETHSAQNAQITIITHVVRQAAIDHVIEELKESADVIGVTSILKVEEN
ncbi:homoserine dehydrogenase [Arcanobacterium bovis]|uniref:Homoserine dehydrogenase n=1 Tax=Arcanobacterium bovis TaxID=2529275 RepID=A0A4V2KR28_9ACTO|nr:homoserine dehydrogenase [Arcanobacterium bovis]TBW21558.1 homoserine dehydrogenase [Arcanobacterium bovis]